MNSLPHNDKVVLVTPPAAIIDNAAVTTGEIDTVGYDYLRVFVIIGATDIALSACQLTESDTSGSGHAAVTGLVYGTSENIAGSTSSLPSATDDNSVFAFEVDLRKRKRYVDVGATVGDGTAGAFVTVIALLSRADEALQSASARGFADILRV